MQNETLIAVRSSNPQQPSERLIHSNNSHWWDFSLFYPQHFYSNHYYEYAFNSSRGEFEGIDIQSGWGGAYLGVGDKAEQGVKQGHLHNLPQLRTPAQPINQTASPLTVHFLTPGTMWMCVQVCSASLGPAKVWLSTVVALRTPHLYSINSHMVRQRE